MKVLTILVPVYNTEKYIRRCLDSLLVPEVLESIEVLVVNDGSKDRSPKIAQEYAEAFPDTVVLVNKENGRTWVHYKYWNRESKRKVFQGARQ